MVGPGGPRGDGGAFGMCAVAGAGLVDPLLGTVLAGLEVLLDLVAVLLALAVGVLEHALCHAAAREAERMDVVNLRDDA